MTLFPESSVIIPFAWAQFTYSFFDSSTPWSVASFGNLKLLLFAYSVGAWDSKLSLCDGRVLWRSLELLILLARIVDAIAGFLVILIAFLAR